MKMSILGSIRFRPAPLHGQGIKSTFVPYGRSALGMFYAPLRPIPKALSVFFGSAPNCRSAATACFAKTPAAKFSMKTNEDDIAGWLKRKGHFLD